MKKNGIMVIVSNERRISNHRNFDIMKLLLLFFIVLWCFTAFSAAAQTPSSSKITNTLVYHEITSLTTGVNSNNGLHPVLSDSGNRAAFSTITYTPERMNHIYVINADGTGQREVDAYPGDWSAVDISADGSKVISSNDRLIRIVNSDGSGMKKLIEFEFGRIHGMKISGDGTRVFFRMFESSKTVDPPGAEMKRGIWVMDASGANLRQIVGPEQVAPLLGVQVSDVPWFDSIYSHSGLDVSTDGSRIVFAMFDKPVAGGAGQRIFSVNLDGTGLVSLTDRGAFVGAVISNNGNKVAFERNIFDGPEEIIIINSDGTGRKTLVSKKSDGSSPFPTGFPSYEEPLTLSADGSKVLLGNTAILLDAATGETLQLAVRGGWWSADPAPVLYDGMYMPTMDSTARRFLYIATDANGVRQLATLDINPASLGLAPSITDPMVDPTYVLTKGRSAATISGRISTSNVIARVGDALLRNGMADPTFDPSGSVMLDDGSQGDITTSDSIFTNNKIRTTSDTVVGPRKVRIKAETKAGDGKRHATAVEFEPFAVSETPGAAPTAAGTQTPGITGQQPPGSSVPPPPFGTPEPASSDRMTLQAGQRRVASGDLVMVPVWLIKGTDVANIDFTISYDSSVARPEGKLNKGNLLENALFESNTGETGLIRAAFAQKSGVSGTGTVAWIPFRAFGKPGAKTILHLEVPSINNPSGTVLIIDRIEGLIQITGPGGTDVPQGDCNGDGVLNADDALCALQMSVRLIPERLTLDLNADNRVTSRDSALILQTVSRKLTEMIR